MSSFIIHGGRPLCGEVEVGGSKNAALPMMAAAILADGPVELQRAPRVADVATLAAVLKELGMSVAWTGDGLRLETIDATRTVAPWRLVRRMRASFCVLGPLVARRGMAIVPLPGGCNIGDRPVDLHLKGLAALGADLKLDRGCVIATAKRLRGATVDLSGPRGPTVTGTANILCAAVLARGATQILAAAREPEIVDLGRLLASMGARIAGLGTSTIEVRGVESLAGTVHRVIPDRIETATLLIAAAITGGQATALRAAPEHLQAVLARLAECGAEIEAVGQRVSLRAASVAGGQHRRRAVSRHPHRSAGAMDGADVAGPRAQHDRRPRLSQPISPRRRAEPPGARIVVGEATATVAGVAGSAARRSSHPTCASAALVLAGLAAEATTTVHAIAHLDRGYERLDEKLRRLGARIERVAAGARRGAGRSGEKCPTMNPP